MVVDSKPTINVFKGILGIICVGLFIAIGLALMIGLIYLSIITISKHGKTLFSTALFASSVLLVSNLVYHYVYRPIVDRPAKTLVSNILFYTFIISCCIVLAIWCMSAGLTPEDFQ